jgi:hypothetical protein
MWRTTGKEEVMTSVRFTRPLFALALLLVLCAAIATASQKSVGPGEKDLVNASSCQRCGDGYCAPSCENERTCPADCRATKLVAPAPAPAPAAVSSSRCGKCGDGQCVKSCGETPQSCPIDCGIPSED